MALDRDASIMRFHANSVSALEEGDYFQIWLDTEDSAKQDTDPHEADASAEPYRTARNRAA